MSAWVWYCIRCNTPLGFMVGKHKHTCPKCGCKSAYCSRREGGEQLELFAEVKR